MEKNDETRADILALAGNTDSEGRPTALALTLLNSNGICFKEDVDSASEEEKEIFLAQLSQQTWIFSAHSYEELNSRENYYKYGLSRQFTKVGAVISNAIHDGIAAVKDDGYRGVYGVLRGAQGVVEFNTEVLLGTFFDIEKKTLDKYLAKILPSEAALRNVSFQAFQKGYKAAEQATFWGAAGLTVGGLFGFSVGAIGGAIKGAIFSNGKVRQTPRGGIFRSLKFTGIGALSGAAIVGGIYFVSKALALVGIIGTSMATGFLLPAVVAALFFGAVLGYHIAHWTGKDTFEIVDAAEDLTYHPPQDLIESGFLANVPPKAEA